MQLPGGFDLSEHDFLLKTMVRRLFWHQGFSTRLNVKLSAMIDTSSSKTRAPLEEYTDIDVLGVMFTPDFRLRIKIADCKTSPKKIAERIFWVQGVNDFVHADDSYVVRPFEFSHSNRQLASRLNISLLSRKDLEFLTPITIKSDDDEITKSFFDGSAYQQQETIISNLETQLEPLKKYRVSYYWLLEPYRNLQQLIVYLNGFNRILRPDNKVHMTLFLDYVWLYTLTVFRAMQSVVSINASEIDRSTRQYLLGGEVNLREKEATMNTLRELRYTIEGKQVNSATDIFQVLPSYYESLLELISRFILKPRDSSNVIRYAEWLSLCSGITLQPTSIASTLIPVNPVSVKLLNDVAKFLVEAGELNKGFIDSFVENTNKTFGV